MASGAETAAGARPRILIAEPQGFSSRARGLLEEVGEVELRGCDRAALAAALTTYDVVWVRLGHHVDRALLEGPLRCRIIATPTTGLDHLDLEACAERGIQVISLRGSTDFLRDVRATAELTVGLAIALLRQLPAAIEHVKAGGWDRDRFRGRELYGKTAGIVGVGRLGTLVAGYFRAFGMEVLGFDRGGKAMTETAAPATSLLDLLERSDVVSLHVDYEAANHHLIGADELAAMRPSAVLINTARGGLVDERALLDALHAGRLAGAALDVLQGEPAIDARHPLVAASGELANLIIVPHIGGNTAESGEKTDSFLASRLVEALSATPA